MKHIVFLKLTPGADAAEVKEKLWKTYRKLDDELDWLNHPVIYRRSDDIESTYDLMVSVELESEAQVAEYLAHPLTRKLAGKLAPEIEGKATFNHY